jgi:hypothetical protein
VAVSENPDVNLDEVADPEWINDAGGSTGGLGVFSPRVRPG